MALEVLFVLPHPLEIQYANLPPMQRLQQQL
jgi:hypothetical protein